jgi:hypothetical protein
MLEIDGFNELDCTSRFACGLSSPASFSPEDHLASHAELPNSTNKAATTSIIEPISLRVSSLALPK